MLLKALLSIKTYLTFKFKVFFLVIPTGYYRKKRKKEKKIGHFEKVMHVSYGHLHFPKCPCLVGITFLKMPALHGGEITSNKASQQLWALITY
jgi:hypothetical protein